MLAEALQLCRIIIVLGLQKTWALRFWVITERQYSSKGKSPAKANMKDLCRKVEVLLECSSRVPVVDRSCKLAMPTKGVEGEIQISA